MLILQSFRVTADDPLSGAKISINGKVEAYIIHPANFLKFLLFWIAVGHTTSSNAHKFLLFRSQPEFSRSNLYHQKTTGHFCEHSMKKSNPCLKMSWFTVRLPAFSQLTTIYWKIWISIILSDCRPYSVTQLNFYCLIGFVPNWACEKDRKTVKW